MDSQIANYNGDNHADADVRAENSRGLVEREIVKSGVLED